MPAEPRVLVTRPAAQAGGLVSDLQAAGFATLELPMLQVEALAAPSATERQHLLDLDRYQHLIFISANAARYGLAWIDDYWPQYPVGVCWWAVGDSTAAVLEASGLPVQRPEQDMRSEGLLAMPALTAPAGERVLIVKGQGGRETLQETLAARGARVDTMCCYRRGATALTPAACRERLAAAPVSLIMISSGEGLEQLSRLLSPRENTKLADTALLVPSPRVARQAEDLGWRRVQQADGASDEAMLAAAKAWRDRRDRGAVPVRETAS